MQCLEQITTMTPETAYPGDDHIVAWTKASCWDSHKLIYEFIGELFLFVNKHGMYLQLIDIVGDMSLVLGIWNICCQSWHKLNVCEISLFAFEFEVGIDGEVEYI